MKKDRTQLTLFTQKLTNRQSKWIQSLRDVRDQVSSQDALVVMEAFERFKDRVRVPDGLVTIWLEAFCRDGKLVLSDRDFEVFLEFLLKWRLEQGSTPVSSRLARVWSRVPEVVLARISAIDPSSRPKLREVGLLPKEIVKPI